MSGFMAKIHQAIFSSPLRILNAALLFGEFIGVFGLISISVFASALGLGIHEEYVFFIEFGWSRSDVFFAAFALGIVFFLHFILTVFLPGKIASRAAYFLLVATVCPLAAVYLFEILIAPQLSRTGFIRSSVTMTQREVDLRTFDLYPFTGWHIQADLHHVGPLQGEKLRYETFDMKSGPLGFFTELDVRVPLSRKVNEFRIALIGGSGAQGWGGQTNNDMFFRKLEHRLSERMGDLGVRVKVINMAMAGSVSYQNFIALNRWGHNLKPDMILSYSGVNDIQVPVGAGSEAHMRFFELSGLSLLARASEYPLLLRPLAALFPNTFNRTGLGPALKLLFGQNYFIHTAKRRYREQMGTTDVSYSTVLDTVAIPAYVRSFKSIKRDFQGVPVVVALQAMSRKEVAAMEPFLGKGYYERFFNSAVDQLRGYINDDWLFLNVHGALADRTEDYIGIHLGNEGHTLVADMLADAIEPFARQALTQGAR